ncbi:MAG: MFS transporter [Rhodanobacter sp.]
MLPQTVQPPLSRSLVLLLATACGVFVASIYFNQPLLGAIAADLHTSVPAIAAVPTATQIGYAMGLLLFGPLGDRFERRRVISIMGPLLALALFATTAVHSLAGLIAASFAVGLLATVTQQIIPLAAHLAAPEERGRTVGTVMSGLLLGILCGRFFSGYLGSVWGWRSAFALSGVLVLALVGLLRLRLPRVHGEHHVSYPQLLASVFGVGRRHATLREAALVGALLFGAFSVFWVSLTPLLAGPTFGLDGRTAGTFGLIGAAGALIAPIAGRRADRSGPRRVLSWAIGAVLLSFVVFAMGGHSLWLLALGTVILDLGIQAALIANQTRIFALDPAARSRINAFFMTMYFGGGALGSALAGIAWQHGGWLSAMGAGGLLTVGAGVAHMALSRNAARQVAVAQS